MLKRYSSACLDRDMGQIDVHAHVDTKWKARAHLTFAATDEIASFLRFLLLDTAVPMLAWKQRRSESGSFQKKITTQRKGVGGCKKNNKKNKQTPSLITRPLMNQKKKKPHTKPSKKRKLCEEQKQHELRLARGFCLHYAAARSQSRKKCKREINNK